MIREPELDGRSFQSLVDEARTRLTSRCPEWTEHNVSDPGMTLIEQFAWMVELLLYRVNRLPAKVHVELLELLGVELNPPTAARAGVRFMLVEPATAPVSIPAGTEVASAHADTAAATVFRVTDGLVIPALAIEAAAVQRAGNVTGVPVDRGVAQPASNDRAAFGTPPSPGDAFYLGFRASLARLVVRLDLRSSPAYGTGIVPGSPPLVWEASHANGVWTPAEVLEDRAGGLNFAEGDIVLQMPPDAHPVALQGRRLSWLRCRIADPEAQGHVDGYTEPPHVESVTAAAVGALVEAEHTVLHRNELLGYSDGTPAQTFSVRHAPTLPLGEDEGLEVLDGEAADGSRKEWRSWEERDSLGDSAADDLHYTYDAAAGEVRLGVALRVPGGWLHKGAIPPANTPIRMRSYRHGGGRAGNVDKDTLTVLRKAIPGVDRVTNPRPATGGSEVETLDEARVRASDDIRTLDRAVTLADFDIIARRAPGVARAKCLLPEPGRAIPIRILPEVDDPRGRPLAWHELMPDEDVRAAVRDFLDDRTLLGTSVHVAPARLRAVTVVASVRREAAAVAAEVREAVTTALYDHLSPVAVAGADGWPWGGTLHPAELPAVVRRVPGVASVDVVRCYETDARSLRPSDVRIEGPLQLEPDELIVSGRHVVRVEP